MKKLMNLNKETALRLWVRQFGKKQKAIDFSGREIAKAAYNDRNSKFGWNVDHILPLSKSGKTVDYNLVCCHILTNEEKADKFPCFKANEKEFEIQRRQNHYEIVAKTAGEDVEEDESVNFLDVAQGLNCWKRCKFNPKSVFVGYVKIRVEISNEYNQLLERYGKFLRELFGTESVFAEAVNAEYICNYYMQGEQIHRTYIYTVIVDDIPTQEDTENFLDDCITLNTYNIYFTNRTGLENIQIICGMECYDSCFEAFLNCKKDILEKQVRFNGSLAIDELVKMNTSVKDRVKDTFVKDGFYSYDIIFARLKKNLENYI